MSKVVADNNHDTESLRLAMNTYCEKNRIGHAQMILAINIANELDDARRELSFSRNVQQKKSVREFMENIISKDIIAGEKYGVRIELDDGGENSYISLCVDVENYKRVKPVVRGLRLFRHSNSINKLVNTWDFELGGICHPYVDNPDIPLSFTSYGKTADEAETEATGYFSELRKLIQKCTSEYKISAAETAEEERQKLLARLQELDNPVNEQ